MILSFTALDKQAKLRKFSCVLDELEVALDVLTTITSFGDTILDAQIAEDDLITKLPCEAFDGESMSVPIQQLEQEWKAILDAPPVRVQPDDAEPSLLLTLTRQRIRQYEYKLNQLDRTSRMFERLIAETEEKFSEGVRKKRLLDHYRQALKKHQRFTQRNRVEYRTLLNRLSQLASR